MFTLASIVFFIVGFLFGRFCQKKRRSSRAAAGAESVPPLATGGEQTQIPYDNVGLQQEVVELKDNVAYGPIQ